MDQRCPARLREPERPEPRIERLAPEPRQLRKLQAEAMVALQPRRAA